MVELCYCFVTTPFIDCITEAFVLECFELITSEIAQIMMIKELDNMLLTGLNCVIHTFCTVCYHFYFHIITIAHVALY